MDIPLIEKTPAPGTRVSVP